MDNEHREAKFQQRVLHHSEASSILRRNVDKRECGGTEISVSKKFWSRPNPAQRAEGFLFHSFTVKSYMADTANEKYTELELYDLQLYEQLEYLERNIASIEQDLADPPDDSLPDDLDAEALPETIKAVELECDQLRTDLASAFQEGVIKTTALQSLNASHLVIKNLYPE